MEYIKYKDADKTINNSKHVVINPYENKNKWNKIFNNNNPICLELGMGRGAFIIEMAKLHPNINFIGIEKYDSVIAKALQKIPEGINNLYMIRADALNIDNIFKREIDCIYLNFSDPWPKKRHHLRRLSSSIFLEKYESIFKDKRIIEMRTDNRELFEYSIISFSGFGYIIEEIYLDFHLENPPLITTEYEDKFSNNKMPIFYVKCFKV